MTTAPKDSAEGQAEPDEALPEPVSGAQSAALFEAFFAPRRHVLLAVSGGADSTALLVLAAEWADKRARPKLSVATVDHALRPEAAEEIEAVARIAEAFDLPHARLPAPVEVRTKIESTARTLRYEALVGHAKAIGADALATAHTLDDQAETVLMRIAAGSGPVGLSAMRPVIDRDGVAHVRPFLTIAKSNLVASLEQRVMRWADDAMNADPAFARARLRAGREALTREGLTPERLATLAFRMARVNEAVDASVDAAEAAFVSPKSRGQVIAPGAARLPDEVKLRLLGRVAHAVGGGRVHLERLERLADRIVTEPSGAATLAGARLEWRDDGRIVVRRAPPRRRDGADGPAGL
ncbi:tRNA lysidine(34) synthetase TilS [Methylopila sp. M107]|uniref:tRNA lysidine(34) synthetase TilS n=1 Tax=Methylopila sp. M107 TaxID=1101190 RepID=UPI000373F027|nr:tRNA lysidine(34) synthetase TilS [Methylopila sp. M107]